MRFRLFIYVIILMLFCNQPVAANEKSDKDESDKVRSGADILIEVRESVRVNSRKITLGDIADIEAPTLFKRQIASIDMGFAPAHGKTKIIDGKQLESKIKSSRILYTNRANLTNRNSSKGLNSDNNFSDVSSVGTVSILVPEKIYIERASQEISEHDLKILYESYVAERLNGKDFEIRDFSLRDLDIYPEGEVKLSSPITNSGEIKGRVTLYVKVKIEGKDYGKISLSGWLDIFDDVLCASKSLSRGKIVEQGDVCIQRVNIANIHGDYFSAEQDVIGKVLTKNATANKPITPNMVEDAALVRKGDRVKIVAARGNLRIITIGIVKSDGRMDDTVLVQNMSSGKIINAIVTGKESVKVFY